MFLEPLKTMLHPPLSHRSFSHTNQAATAQQVAAVVHSKSHFVPAPSACHAQTHCCSRPWPAVAAAAAAAVARRGVLLPS